MSAPDGQNIELSNQALGQSLKKKQGYGIQPFKQAFCALFAEGQRANTVVTVGWTWQAHSSGEDETEKSS